MVQLGVSILRLIRPGLRFGRRLGAALIAAMAMGCALKTPPAHEALVTEALPEGTTVPPAWKAGNRGDPVTDNWLRTFDDPALEAIVAEAIANNLDLRQAAERVTIAQQSVIVVGSQLLPRVDAVAGARSTRDADENETNNTNLAYASLAWELDVWGKLRAQRAASQAGYEATALDYAWARQSLAATVAKTWYLASESRQLLILAEQSVVIYGELLDLVNIRRSAGKDSNLDVVDTRAKLEEAESTVAIARQAYGDAQRGLEVLLGRYPAAEIEAEAAYPALPAPAAPGVPASLLGRRPDLLASERIVLAAFRQAEAANLALYPAFSISLIGGRLGDQIPLMLDLNPWLGSAAIGVSVPIYEGGALRAQIRIADAQQAQAVASYGSTVLRAFREVEDGLANEQLLAKRLPLEESSARDRLEAVNIATIQYKAGRRDLLWVSNLQTNQIASQADVIRLRGFQRVNRIRLYQALGGNFEAGPVTGVP